MFSFIESRCHELGDEKDYINYILSMDRAKSIEDLIKIYNNGYKILAYLFFRSNKLDNNWYITETWGYKNGWLIDELSYCLNENILNWYKRQENISDEIALKCIVNLRYASNTGNVEKEILSHSNPQADGGITNLSRIRNNHFKLRKKISVGSNKCWEKEDYISSCRYLAAHGRIFDIAETKSAKKMGIPFDNLVAEYKIEKEEEKRRIKEQLQRLEEERRLEERKKANQEFFNLFDSVGGAVFSFLFSLPFAFFGGIISNIGKKR